MRLYINIIGIIRKDFKSHTNEKEVHSVMKKAVDYIEYFLFLVPAKLIRILNLKSAYFLARIFAFCAYHIDSKHRKRIITHILHSGILDNEKDAKILAKKNFVHMAKIFVEIIKFDQIINEENYKEYVSVDPELSKEIQDALKEGSSIPFIAASMHLGNWELSANCYCYYSKQAVCSIMRPLPNQLIGNYIYRKRTGIDHETVARDKGVKPLLTALRSGKTIALVVDQHANHSEGIEHLFFGHPARTHMTPAMLHLKTGIPLLPLVFVRKDDEFHFMMTTAGDFIRYTPTGDKEKDIRNITETYAVSFEKLIRKYPDQWIWEHRRWLDCGRKGSWSPDHFNNIKSNQTIENDKQNA